MIKYKVTVGDITTELECQTIGELIEYLNYDKETVEVSKEPLVWDNRLIGLKDSPSFFVRPDNTFHQPKTETINGEEWYVNDGQQPVGDGTKVDIKYRNSTTNYNLYANSVKYCKDYIGPYKVETSKMSNDWIEWTWTEEKPYPETLETKVYVKQADGFCDEGLGSADTVGYWYDEDHLASNWFQDHEDKCYITHYKLA